MKKLIPIFLLCLFANRNFAQNLDEINDLLLLFKNTEAKAAIDKYLSNPKKATNPEAWYLKGKIYFMYSNDSSVSVVERYDLLIDAFKAFQENQRLDKKDSKMNDENHVSYFKLYGEMYNNGIINYNAKNYQGAFQGFKMANEIKDFIISKNYKNDDIQVTAFDTSLISNIAYCAILAKNEPEAVFYYSKLADANVSEKQYQEIYQYLIEYYKKNNNEKAFNELLTKAKKLYPNEEIWDDIELKAVEEKSGKKALFEKYDELIKQNPNNFNNLYFYSLELYNSLYEKGISNPRDTSVRSKINDVLRKAIAIEGNKDVSAKMLMCFYLHNYTYELSDSANAIKSSNPVLQKKKSNFKYLALKVADDCINYALIIERFFDSIPEKTKAQKTNYKIIIGKLSDLYAFKENKIKIEEYEKKNKAADFQ